MAIQLNKVGKMKRKIIQISTATTGDNVNAQESVVTTVLYDDGAVYQGQLQTVGGNYDDGFQYGMAWCRLQAPDEQS